MKRYFLLIALLGMTVASFAQFNFGQPPQKSGDIRVKASVEKAKIQKGDEVQITLDVDIDKGWHLYANDFNCDPIKFEVSVDESSNVQPSGPLKAVNPHVEMDDIFGCEVKFFEKKGKFVLPVSISESGKVTGTYEGQICEDNGVCLQVDGTWEVEIELAQTEVTPQKDPVIKETNPEKTGSKDEPNVESVAQDNKGNSSSNCNCCNDLNTKVDSLLALSQPDARKSYTGECDMERRAGWDDIFVEGAPPTDQEGGLWLFFWVSFLSGFVALLTPCVFPLIPMTVTFFTKQSGSKGAGIRKAFIYGVSIIVIYTLIGLLFSKILGVDAANELSTGWINIIFFTIFFIFALSFLGMFELTIPHRFVNKMDRQGDKGGLIGIFFMAFTLALVSFSCTGPIAGSILIQSAGGSWLKPIIGMFGFSLALALPFTLFAIFPQWLQSLPKSGGWLNTVKVVLGLLELALGFKFLSNADQAYHWHLLDREVFLSIWIVIFLIMGIYLLGKLRFPHDSPIEKLGVARFIVALFPLIFVVYMIPGLFGAPLKSWSGIFPPLTTQDFDLARIIRDGGSSDFYPGVCSKERRYAETLHLPHGLQGYFDLREAICCSREQGKPMFIDFTGHSCANCRQMENNVWTDPSVYNRLKEDFIVVAIYVDDKEIALPEAEWYKRKSDGDLITTLGKQNFDLGYTKFNVAEQPSYMVVGFDEIASTKDSTQLKVFTYVRGYDPDVDKFVKFLDRGKEGYRKMNKSDRKKSDKSVIKE